MPKEGEVKYVTIQLYKDNKILLNTTLYPGQDTSYTHDTYSIHIKFHTGIAVIHPGPQHSHVFTVHMGEGDQNRLVLSRGQSHR